MYRLPLFGFSVRESCSQTQSNERCCWRKPLPSDTGRRMVGMSPLEAVQFYLVAFPLAKYRMLCKSGLENYRIRFAARHRRFSIVPFRMSHHRRKISSAVSLATYYGRRIYRQHRMRRQNVARLRRIVFASNIAERNSVRIWAIVLRETSSSILN